MQLNEFQALSGSFKRLTSARETIDSLLHVEPPKAGEAFQVGGFPTVADAQFSALLDIAEGARLLRTTNSREGLIDRLDEVYEGLTTRTMNPRGWRDAHTTLTKAVTKLGDDVAKERSKLDPELVSKAG